MMLRSLATLVFAVPVHFVMAQAEPTLATPPKPSELPAASAPAPAVPEEAALPAPITPPKPLIGIHERMALGLLRQFVPAERQRSFDNVVDTLQEVAEQVDAARGVGNPQSGQRGVVQAEARTRRPTRRERRALRDGKPIGSLNEPLPTLNGPIGDEVREIEQTAGRVQNEGVLLDNGPPRSTEPAAQDGDPNIFDSFRMKLKDARDDEQEVKRLLNRLEQRLREAQVGNEIDTWRKDYAAAQEDGSAARKEAEKVTSEERLRGGNGVILHSHRTGPGGVVLRHGYPGWSNPNNQAIKKLLSERDHLREMLEKARKAEQEATKELANAIREGEAQAGHKNPFRGKPTPDAGHDESHGHAHHDHDHAAHDHPHGDKHDHPHRQPMDERQVRHREAIERAEAEARARAEAMRRDFIERQRERQHHDERRREHEEIERHMHELKRDAEMHRLDVARRELHLEQSHLRAETAADPLPVAIWAVERVIDLYGGDATKILRDLQDDVRDDVVRRYITMRLAEIAEDDRDAAIGPLKELILGVDRR